MTTTITISTTITGTGAYYVSRNISATNTNGIKFTGATATLTNDGTISSPSGAGGNAVYFAAAGILTNKSAGYVHGVVASDAAVDFNSAGTVVNYGKIVATVGAASGAIVLSHGGAVTNKSGARITGQISSTGAVASVTNAGTIQGGSGGGKYYGAIYLGAGGSVTNLTGGQINANTGNAYGVAIIGAGTITNAGTIDGGGRDAVDLYGSGTHEMIVDAGGSFVGYVVNAIGSTGILLLASGASAGTLNATSGEFKNFGTLSIASGATWTVDADSTFGTMFKTIAGFTSGDGILLSGDTVSHSSASGGIEHVTLTGSEAMTLAFAGTFAGGFTVTAGGILETVCFCRGTRILTPAGEVAIETLSIGDKVVTLGHGNARTINWIGKGKVLATRGRRGAATPVIVKKHALAPNVPHADLRVTKAHSLYFDGVLIPVGFLVNHKTILWDDRAQEVEIYHIELDSHDVLIANGAPAETFREDGNGWMFQNARETPGERQVPYAPVLTGGPVVDAIWERLRDRAGPRDLPPMTSDPDLHLIVDGQRLDPVAQTADSRTFRLRGKPSTVILASRGAVPAEFGFARDPRSLGVALRRVTLEQYPRSALIEADNERLTTGFHDYEAAEHIRWTNGYAELPIEAFARFPTGLDLTVHLGGTTQYPDFGEQRPGVAA